jgi:hypothetical protein
MGTVPLTSGIHQRFESVGVFIGVLHNKQCLGEGNGSPRLWNTSTVWDRRCFYRCTAQWTMSGGGEQFPLPLEYTNSLSSLVFPSGTAQWTVPRRGEQFPSPLEYTDGLRPLVFLTVYCTLNSVWGGEQFPSPLEYTDGLSPSVFPSVYCIVNSVWERGIVPLASGIHRQTQTVGVSINVLHIEWYVVFAVPIYPSYKYLNWKLHAQHKNISSHNNHKINTSLLRISSITIYYIIVCGITVLSCFHS